SIVAGGREVFVAFTGFGVDGRSGIAQVPRHALKAFGVGGVHASQRFARFVIDDKEDFRRLFLGLGAKLVVGGIVDGLIGLRRFFLGVLADFFFRLQLFFQ